LEAYVEVLIAQLIGGIKLGSLYAVVVIGFNLLILVTGVMHLGYPTLLVLSMYLAWFVLSVTNNNIFLGIAAAIVSGPVIGALTAPLFLPLVKRKAHLEALVVSLAIGIICSDIMSHWFNLGLPIAFPPALQLEGHSIKWGLAVIRMGELVTLAVSIIVVFAFLYFLNKTKQGRVLRAVAQDNDVARILGISVSKVSVLSFALTGLLGGITAILFAMSTGAASADLGDNLGMKCLAILFSASIGNLRGGLICALGLGIIESLAMTYLPGDWTNAIAFSAIVVVLLFKPTGIFGEQH
jgi:branched-chain amino acid transport system permease protein